MQVYFALKNNCVALLPCGIIVSNPPLDFLQPSKPNEKDAGYLLHQREKDPLRHFHGGDPKTTGFLNEVLVPYHGYVKGEAAKDAVDADITSRIKALGISAGNGKAVTTIPEYQRWWEGEPSISMFKLAYFAKYGHVDPQSNKVVLGKSMDSLRFEEDMIKQIHAPSKLCRSNRKSSKPSMSKESYFKKIYNDVHNSALKCRMDTNYKSRPEGKHHFQVQRKSGASTSSDAAAFDLGTNVCYQGVPIMELSDKDFQEVVLPLVMGQPAWDYKSISDRVERARSAPREGTPQACGSPSTSFSSGQQAPHLPPAVGTGVTAESANNKALHSIPVTPEAAGATISTNQVRIGPFIVCCELISFFMCTAAHHVSFSIVI